MSSQRDLFEGYEEIATSPIHLANGRTIPVKGKGTINITVKIGNELKENYLKEVLYVPDLQGNLFSVNKTIELGNKVTFDTRGCVIKDQTGKMIGIAPKAKNLYRLDVVEVPNRACAANQKALIDLWHL